MLRPLAILACLFPLSGCLIVVDHGDHDSYVRDDDTYHRGRIGVYLDSVEPSTASQVGVDRTRATLVTGVVGDSCAEKAGLKTYDVITGVDGSPDASPSRVRRAIREHKSGEEVSFAILREGKPLTITVPVK